MAGVDFGTVLNGLMVAALVWQSHTMLTATVKLAVHDEKHRAHDARFKIIESKNK